MDFVESKVTVHAVIAASSGTECAISLAVVGLSTGLSDFVEIMVVDRPGDDASIYMNRSVNAWARNGRPNNCVN